MPKLLQWCFPKRLWKQINDDNAVYLTFDDGPIPEVTPWVLEILAAYNAKATFFCLGINVQKHPAIFKKIIQNGHSVGNHGFSHLNGWHTGTTRYIKDIIRAQNEIDPKMESISPSILEENDSSLFLRLFRPPYGRITSKQAEKVQEMGFTIVMWSIISFDYSNFVSRKRCLKNVISNLRPGDIVVFHDSLKAEKNLRYVLPKVLEYCKEKDLSLKGI